MSKLMMQLYALLRKRFYPHYAALHDTFAVIRHLWFVFLLLGVGCFAFVVTEQGQDMLQAMREIFYTRHEGVGYVIKFSIALVVWSAITWCSSRILLMVLEIRTKAAKGVAQWSIRNMPAILGAVPLFGIAFAFSKQDAYRATLFYALLGTVACYLFFQIEKRFSKNNPGFFSQHKQQLGRFASRIVEYGTLFTFIFSLLFVFMPVEWDFAEWLQPGTIILVSLTGWTVFGNVLVYLGIRSRMPVFAIIAVYVIGCSLLNDNHAIRLADKKEKPERPEIIPHFKEWLSRRVQLHPGNTNIPVIVVAAQGGGIRALDWTGSVLDECNTQLPGFSNHIYAISGVSGGSVGGTMYAGYLRDNGNDREKLQELYSSDYLSGITSAMLFPDMLQKFLPFKVSTFDRARYLEDSWSDRYKELFADKNTLDENFLGLWKGNDAQYRVPSLMLNCVLAESGQKAIVSNLKLDPSAFPDAIDVIDSIGCDMPLKTAALCSARFPYVTPGGGVNFGDKSGGHLIDGGYLENTGTITAINLVSLLNSYLKDNTDTLVVSRADKKRVVIVMLYIQNAEFSDKAPQQARFMSEALIPPSGFIGAWNREGLALREEMKQLAVQVDPPFHFIPMILNRRPDSKMKLPLSWYLSPGAAAEIRRQALNISREEVSDNLNFNNFKQLRDLFGETPGP